MCNPRILDGKKDIVEHSHPLASLPQTALSASFEIERLSETKASRHREIYFLVINWLGADKLREALLQPRNFQPCLINRLSPKLLEVYSVISLVAISIIVAFPRLVASLTDPANKFFALSDVEKIRSFASC